VYGAIHLADEHARLVHELAAVNVQEEIVFHQLFAFF
jgi:hypothetical protein